MTQTDDAPKPVLRLFAGGIATETNMFSPLPTGLDDYDVAASDADPAGRSRTFGGSTFARYAAHAAATGCDYVQGTYASAQPAGLTSRRAYETLRDVLLAELRAALPLDGVLLTLHGAMVADGYGDCETDLVGTIRAATGEDTTIGVLLDLHCDIPDKLVALADVIVTYKEYPHIDIEGCADDLARLVIATAGGEVTPAMATFDCRMFGLYPTPPEPMRSFVGRMRSAESEPGIVSVSLGHGFPWGDAPAMGARVLVVADRDRALAERLAGELGRELFSLRHKVRLQVLPMTEALDRALAIRDAPVVVADTADNAGGGASSDSTFVLRELLDRRVRGAALGLLWDPIAVHQAFAVGEGANLTLRLGGKMGPASGQPIDMTVRVRGLLDNLVQRWPQTDGFIEVPCGRSAWLEHDGIDVIVGSVREQVLGLEVFTAFGIDLAERRLLVVKSMNHFHAAYAPIAAEVIYMGAAGALALDPTVIPYQHVDTHQFPWVENPWTRAG